LDDVSFKIYGSEVEFFMFIISGNIPGTDVLKGEMVYDYLPPFPPKGVGFHRMIFVLYKQDAKVDFSKLKKSLPW